MFWEGICLLGATWRAGRIKGGVKGSDLCALVLSANRAESVIFARRAQPPQHCQHRDNDPDIDPDNVRLPCNSPPPDPLPPKTFARAGRCASSPAHTSAESPSSPPQVLDHAKSRTRPPPPPPLARASPPRRPARCDSPTQPAPPHAQSPLPAPAPARKKPVPVHISS